MTCKYLSAISRRTWLHLALMLPLFVQLLFCLAELMLGTNGLSYEFTWLMMIQGYGTLLYFPFALLVIVWGRKKTEEQMIQASWFLPVIFSFFAAGCLSILDYMQGHYYSLAMNSTVGMITITIGYAYVGVVHGIMWMVHRCTCCGTNTGRGGA